MVKKSELQKIKKVTLGSSFYMLNFLLNNIKVGISS